VRVDDAGRVRLLDRRTDLINRGGERLAGFKVPQHVVTASDPLPHNAAGKVDKARLRSGTRWTDAP
jgi:non-ribosomal peptide synthetase component E (peptide arylation enzyme)